MITSTCDHLRAINKVLPPVADHKEFKLCDTIWWFGFLRCMCITNEDQFYPFRKDFITSLIPEYKEVFARYTTVQVRSGLTCVCASPCQLCFVRVFSEKNE